MDLHLQDPDFWESLHGRVPGLLDWDMGNELFHTCTTVHLPPAEQTLAKYKLRIVEPPVLPLDKKYETADDPDIEPNLWMWVNPNIVYPPGKMQVKDAKWECPPSPPSPPLTSQTSVKKEGGGDSEGAEEQGQQPSSSRAPPSEKPKLSRAAVPPPCPWKVRRGWAGSRQGGPGDESITLWLPEEAAAQAQAQDDSSSVALPSPHKRTPLQSRRLRQPTSSEGRLWSRPPLNYFHLIALALRNSPPCGLNVQQIYSFTRYVGALGGGRGGTGPGVSCLLAVPGPADSLSLFGSEDLCLPSCLFSGKYVSARQKSSVLSKREEGEPEAGGSDLGLEKKTAPEGWKNTVRHNLCFRDSFEKVQVSVDTEAGARPRSCLWKLTEEGHRRFEEEARALACTRLESIQQCMSQPAKYSGLTMRQIEPLASRGLRCPRRVSRSVVEGEELLTPRRKGETSTRRPEGWRRQRAREQQQDRSRANRQPRPAPRGFRKKGGSWERNGERPAQPHNRFQRRGPAARGRQDSWAPPRPAPPRAERLKVKRWWRAASLPPLLRAEGPDRS
ncbi:forkhead box protein R1 [Perognathus longimembris pacificus]|uniref:forkhead box protein R1 n=1 Tax=Perognathus longimembris pacificus TaxID=214514 RepID=UPI002019B43D|nr:forkhead box protein R1 [Perognathus longimembris pacificus]